MINQSSNITIIGAGLAGSLLTVHLAQRGFRVDVFERRPDMRKEKISAGRSINLALSLRGIFALKEAGLDQDILRRVIPMKGRMIHATGGELSFQPYGRDETEVINAMSRPVLNSLLMDAAEGYENVTINFNCRCTGMDFRNGEVFFRNEKTGRNFSKNSKTVIATDGAFSAVRASMQREGRFNYSQMYLEHGYKELIIPPTEDGGFRIEKNALHIWPRNSFMMIALPNGDGSFTCTLFLQHKGQLGFEGLSSPAKVREFFRAQFPDAIPLMPSLTKDFFVNPTGSLVTIKCFPWYVGGKALLLGDSAHAIVPFFGQGMNCAFEDCSYLVECIEQDGDDWETVFRHYQELRKENTDAIADMALENFIEMRDSVTNPKFIMKKKLELLLEKNYPEQFRSRYAQVTFSRIPYAEAMRKGRIQEKVLMEVCSGADSVEQIDLEQTLSKIQDALQQG